MSIKDKNTEKDIKTGNIAWAILSLLLSIACIVFGIVFFSGKDKSMLFVAIPLGIFFAIGSFSFFKSSLKAKETASEMKKQEASTYKATKELGKSFSNSEVTNRNLKENEPKATQEITFPENLSVLLNQEANQIFINKAEEMERAINVRDAMMHLSDNQICETIKKYLEEMGIPTKENELLPHKILCLYRKNKVNPFYDVKSDKENN